MGVVDSYGLVELVVAVEDATGIRSNLGAENLKVGGEANFSPSINRLSMALCKVSKHVLKCIAEGKAPSALILVK